MAERRDDFLGRGWAFPPTFGPDGRLAMVSGDVGVRQSLEVLLSTAIGERLLHPRYGCDLGRFAFEPADAGLEARVRDLVETAIVYFEPRVVIEAVAVRADHPGMLTIAIDYLLPATNTRSNMVLPYALGEGGLLDG